MRIHYVMHAPFEGLGAIENWIAKKGYSVTCSRPYQGESLPETSQFDMLILMGGPQSLIQLHQYPYLHEEIALTKHAIQQNKMVLGICLGSQILGEALGAKTERSPNKEIGVYPIEATDEGKNDPIFKQFAPALSVMHWHSDMPGLAKDVVLLARSQGCPRQAFRYGDRVYGFQFHLEITKELLQNMIMHCSEDLTHDLYVQPANELRKLDFIAIHEKMYIALDYFANLFGKK